MKQENAINFLLYSYLGITLKDDKDNKIKAAIIKAYGDATMQGAYNTYFNKSLISEPELSKLKSKSNKARRKSGTLILEEINNFFSSKKNSDYQEWHWDLCKKLIENYKKVYYNNTPFFTYGNAQKWVNMTVKYICIIDSLEKIPELHDQIDTNKDNYHIPIDSYIIDCLWKKEDVHLPLKGGSKRDKTYKIPSEHVKSWSKWDMSDNDTCQQDYSEIQIKIREYISSDESILDWENEQWIEAAKNRKATIDDVFKNNFTMEEIQNA